MSKKNKHKHDYDGIDTDDIEYTLVKGQYDFIDETDIKKLSKKDREKERLKLLKLKDKEIKKQCKCNHIARNTGRCYFRYDPNDSTVMYCKICGAKLLSKEGWNVVAGTEDCVDSATTICRSIIGLARNRIRMNSETYDQFTDALYVISKLPDLYKALAIDDNIEDEDDDIDNPYKSKKKKDKHGKHGKHGKKDKKDKKKKKKNKMTAAYRVFNTDTIYK